jgi:GNAT superfamily N-acetyltransferase
MTPDGFTIRRATIADTGTISGHRRAHFSDMGFDDPDALDAMSQHFRAWLEPRVESGEYLTWLAIASDGAVAAGLGVWLMDWPPHVVGPGARRANILNVYTEPQFRRRSLAELLMQAALDWCRENGIRAVILHAGLDDRSLHESMGFFPTNEMRLMLGG